MPNEHIITTATINRRWKDYVEKVRNYDEPEIPELTKKDWQRNFDILDNWLHESRGTVSKLPLSYVVREDEDRVVPVNIVNVNDFDDAARGAAGIAAPQHGVLHSYYFPEDNKSVYALLDKAFALNTEAHTHIKRFRRRKDGRSAYQALKDQMLGTDAITNLAAQAEATLQRLTYSGESRRFNFDRYVEISTRQHSILEDLEEKGCKGMDDRTKVRLFVEGIKYEPLNPCITQILSSETMKRDFTAAKDLCKNYLESRLTKVKERHATISKFGTKRDGGDKRDETKGDGEADMNVPDRYYKPAEYAKLTKAQKNGLRLKRKKRSKKDDSSKSAKKQKTELHSTIKAVVQEAMAAMSISDESSTNSQGNGGGGNRNNPALERTRRE